jgi:hypothetical protein
LRPLKLLLARQTISSWMPVGWDAPVVATIHIVVRSTLHAHDRMITKSLR